MARMAEFEGTSGNGKFQDALQDAVQEALKNIIHTDPMVSFTVKKITGRRGGIAGFNELTVVIEAELS